MRQRVWRLAAMLGTLGASVAEGQLAPVGAPRGVVRLDFQGVFSSYDQRFLNGQTEDYGADFARDSLGSNFFSALAGPENTIGQIIGSNGYRINLGRQTASSEAAVVTPTIGISLGLTRRLTLFTHVPFVHARVQSQILLDGTTGDAGFNPADLRFGTASGQLAASTFFSEFTAALDALNTNINNGTYDTNPTLKSTAQSVLASGTLLRDQLQAVTTDPVTASSFLPVVTSAAGQTITNRVTGLQDTLSTTLGVSGFSSGVVLPTQTLTPADLSAYITDPAGPIAGRRLGEALIYRMGDMDVGATFTLVDNWDQHGRLGGLRTAVSASLRLPTGLVDSPRDFLDLGTGEGFYAIGLGVTTDIGHGIWGARLAGNYTRRLARLRVERISLPSQPIAPVASLANLRVDAGDILSFSAQPYFRLAPSLALHATVQHWNQGADRVSYFTAADSIPGVDPTVLAVDSKRSATLVGGGITYASKSARGCEGAGCGLPVEASWSYSEVIRASGGRVPRSHMAQVEIRFYARIWR